MLLTSTISNGAASAARSTPRRNVDVGNIQMTTYHNDTMRSGQNLSEIKLNTIDVNADMFGKRVSYPVDGQVYAQPLFMPDIPINGTLYNVVYVVTENDSVYAFDADQAGTVPPLWQTSFINPSAGITTIPTTEVYNKHIGQDIRPVVGITSTPVIDPGTGTLYVVAATKEHGQYVQRLHALDLVTGKDKAGSPTQIQASVPGNGYDSVDGRIHFNAKTENQRAALLLLNGNVYISWAAFGDSDPYHGWILGYHYDGSGFQQLDASAYSDTPNGQEGGIWMSGAGPAADASGNIYVATGNGTFDLDHGGSNASDSYIKFSTQNGLHIADYFTPFNQSCLNGRDNDLGSSGPLILPDQPGNHPHLLIDIGKEGRIYVIDRDNMGHYVNDSKLICETAEEYRQDIDHVVQELPPATTGSLFGITAYWSGEFGGAQYVFAGGFNDHLRAFTLNNGLLSAQSVSQTPETFAFSGATPSISSNGTVPGTGIVWVNAPSVCNYPGCDPRGPGSLHAYDATNLSHELYNSELNPGRDRVDSYIKFSVPTIANGRVFVATQTSLDIYGLLDVQLPQITSIDDSVQGTGINQFNYTGYWRHCTHCSDTNPPMYNLSNSWSTSPQDSVTLNFVGISIGLYGIKRARYGIGALSLDDGPETLLDLFSKNDAGNQLLWTSPTLASGTHVLKFHATGTKNYSSSDYRVAIDRIDITR
ncbi:MAG: hypothetical protein NVS2B12_18140 [Ktedonobacteraceae bacterium]